MCGLLGFPNVGKSTFLSRVTEAKPKIANYHFTTLVPNLGVVKTDYGKSFVIADIPGIIEGASEGTGLGIQFLRHVERTRLLLHFIDVSGSEGRDPIEDFYTINKELKKYSEKLSKRKQILVANKIDVMQDDTLAKKIEGLAKKENLELFKISAVTGQGVQDLLRTVSELLEKLPKEDLEEKQAQSRKIYKLPEKEKGFEIEKQKGIYIVKGKEIERLMGRINLSENESIYYFQKNLKKMGVERELKNMGIQEGDVVKFLDWEFEWFE